MLAFKLGITLENFDLSLLTTSEFTARHTPRRETFPCSLYAI